MTREIPCRIFVNEPMADVAMKVQKGKAELLGPVASLPGKLVFEFETRVDLGSDGPNFLGPFAQGPKGSRFFYLNSGKYAGQKGTMWARRAKLSLVSVTSELVNRVLETPGSVMETIVEGIGPDGGPVCASVKGLEWKVAK